MKVTHNMKEVINHLSYLVLGNTKMFQAKFSLKESQKKRNKFKLAVKFRKWSQLIFLYHLKVPLCIKVILRNKIVL